jgi:hypothetical protein
MEFFERSQSAEVTRRFSIIADCDIEIFARISVKGGR